MMNKKDDVKTFVVIVVVCVICVIIGLILSYKKNTDKMVGVTDYNVFFSNVNYINNYINYVINGNYEAVYNLLDDKYMEDNGITNAYVLQNVGDYSIGASLSVTDMKYVNVKDNFIYYIKGKIYVNTYNGREIEDDNFSMLVITDVDNSSYSLYPVDDDNYEKIINSLWKINVENNQYNGVVDNETINKEQICVIYLSDFVNNIFNDVSSSYELLSNDMKKIYNNSSYRNYISNNISNISTIADKCKLDEVDDKRIYTVIDANENKYIFTENSIMNYEVDFYLNEN